MASADMSAVNYHLMRDTRYLPDILRKYDVLIDTIQDVLKSSTKPMGIYKDDTLKGFWLMTGIEPDHQGRLLYWSWGSWVSPEAVKELKADIFRNMRENSLRRVFAQTPDRRLIRLLKLVGFKEEGRFPKAYKFNGKLYSLYQTRLLIGG